MSILDEFELILKKITLYVLAFILSFVLLLFAKSMLIVAFTPLLGEENAIKLVNGIFLTPSQLILEQYGITLYSGLTLLGIILLPYLKQ